MTERIISILKRVFENVQIDENSSSENVPEWDSIHQLSIAFEIENDFGISLEPEDIVGLKSVKAITSFLANKK